MKIKACGITDCGQVRPANEDCYVIDQQTGLCAVADGMGGHKSGEIASRMAVDILKEYLAKVAAGSDSFLGSNDSRVSRAANLLGSGIRLANLAIFEAAQSAPELRGMGTTIVAILPQDERIGIAHAGDSRLYLLHQQQLRQITWDHSLVAEKLQQGLITPQEAVNSHEKNIITRALGQWQQLEIELQDLELEVGDRLLLCSDGLSGMVSDAEIAALLKAYPDQEQAAAALVEVANSYGGRDNITVVVVDVLHTPTVMAGIKRLFGKG